MRTNLRAALPFVLGCVVTALFAGPSQAQTETVVASDDFNRADEQPFATTGNWGRTIAGNFDGFSNLINNHVVGGSNEGIYYWKGAGSFSPTSQFARETVVDSTGEPALILNAGADYAILLTWGPPGPGSEKSVFIYWYSGGADRGVLKSAPSPLADGDVIEAVLQGGVISAKVNGVTVASVANTTTITSGTPGFMTYLNPSLPDLRAVIDDWQGGNLLSYSISGTITENGSPLAGVLVTASGGFTGTATTNGAGSYTIAGIPPNAATVTLTPALAGHTMSPTSLSVPGPINADAISQDFTSTGATDATLTVLTSHGSVLRNPSGSVFALGTQVTLTPVPDDGYSFVGWSGDVPAGHLADDPLVVTMNQDRSITAIFGSPNATAADDFNRPDETPLSVGGNWQQAFPGGTADLVGNQVTGIANDALYFWQGAGDFSNTRQYSRLRVVDAGGQVGLVLLGAVGQGLIASWHQGILYIYWYSAGSYRGNLTTLPSNIQNGDIIEAELQNGIVTAKINGTAVLTTPNTTTLTAGKPGFETFQTGAVLDDWEAGTPFSYTISGTITENAAPLGGVLVTASGGYAATATSDVNGNYTIAGVPPNATAIVLTPTLADHTMSPLHRTVDGPVVANVTGEDFTSTASETAFITALASHGTVTRTPDQTEYILGEEVSLFATPESGYSFAGWTGDVLPGQETTNPLLIAVDHDRTLTAVFLRPLVNAAEYFDRADETPFAIGGNWAQSFGTGSANANLVNGQIAGQNGEALYYWQGTGNFTDAKQYARARVVDPSGQVGLILLGGPGQALVVSWHDSVLYIYWYTGGSYRGNLTTLPSTIQPGDIIEGELVNGVVNAKINGVTVLSTPNTTTLTSGKPGFETFQGGGVIDDWEAGIADSFPVPAFPYMTP